MLSDIEKILLLFQDMQEMVSPDDELSDTITKVRKNNIELHEDELDLISAAGNPDLSNNIKND